MLQPGDICIINERVNESSSGLYRSLIGKQVMITSINVVNGKYPVQVMNPNPENPWEFSSQLQVREEFLTKE
jgi:hypothetical protein